MSCLSRLRDGDGRRPATGNPPRLPLAALCRVGLLLAAAPAAVASPAAAPGAPEALVLANVAYAGLPRLASCAAAAGLVGDALRAAGFATVVRVDASNGEVSGAIAGLATRVSGPPPGSGLLYACGLVTSFQDRGFLVPAGATLSRSADILTQGVLVGSLRRTLAQSGAATSLLAIDAFPLPDHPGGQAGGQGADALASTLQAAVGGAHEPELGTIVAVQVIADDAAPPLAVALAEALRDRRPGADPSESGALVERLRLAVASRPGLAVLARPPTARVGPGAAPVTPAGMTEPAHRLPTLPPAPAASPGSAPAASAVPATQASDAPSAETGFPEERASDAQRRQIQVALGRLGYYGGAPDGVFGPDTRAAMRRFQHELGADMTGHLSAAQTARLLATP